MRIVLISALIAVGMLQGCASHAPMPMGNDKYQFDLHAVNNSEFAPTAFSDRTSTYFAVAPSRKISAAINCEGGNARHVSAYYDAPYWTVDEVSNCWEIETQDGVFRLVGKQSSQDNLLPATHAGDYRHGGTAQASVPAGSCEAMDGFEKRLDNTREKVSQLALLIERNTTCAQPVLPMVHTVAVPFPRGTRILDESTEPLIEQLIQIGKSAKIIKITGRYQPDDNPKINKWYTDGRVQSVRNALITGGISPKIIKQHTQTVKRNNLWVSVEIR